MCDALPRSQRSPALPRPKSQGRPLGRALPLLALLGALWAGGLLAPTSAMAQQKDPQPWLGVVMEPRSTKDPKAKEAATDAAPGVRVTRTLKRSPAHLAALQPGDRILAVNGHATPTPQALQIHIKAMRPGQVANLDIARGTLRLTQAVTLTEAPRLEDALAREFVGQPAPALSLKALSGTKGTLELAALRGKPTVLEFWTTWCGPCKLLAQDLAKLHAAHPGQIHIVSVSAEDEATIGEYLAHSPIPWTVAHDPREQAHQEMMVHSFPVTFVLDREQRVARVFIGGDQGPAIARLIGELLGDAKAPRAPLAPFPAVKPAQEKQKADP